MAYDACSLYTVIYVHFLQLTSNRSQIRFNYSCTVNFDIVLDTPILNCTMPRKPLLTGSFTEIWFHFKKQNMFLF